MLSAAHDIEDAAIATAIEMLLRHDRITLQDADIVEMALENYRYKPALGFSDCLVLEIARKNGHLPLGTFDKSLAKLSGCERL
jgi:predicted nucleic-acid-binding protein